jgi:uncharacterized protein YbjT (DUF2867 family)
MTTSSKKLKVLVYGATGSQSNSVVWQLLANGHQPYVFTRSAAKAAAMQQAGAVIIEGDITNANQVQKASEGMDAVSLLLPFFMQNHVLVGKQIINGAKTGGVKLIVWNTSGPTPPVPTGNPAYDARIEITDYLATSGVPHIIFQPTIYAENLLGPWTVPALQRAQVLNYPLPETVKAGWLVSEDVGKLEVAALERPELAGTNVVISGKEALTGPQLAAQFSEALQLSIKYRAMPPQEFSAVLDNLFGPGAGTEVAGSYQKIWDDPQIASFSVDMEGVLAKFPVQMTSMSEWVNKHQAVFLPSEELTPSAK